MKAELRALAGKLWSEECRSLAQSTDRFLNNIFLFNDPWDMEQCTIPVEFKGPIDWNYYPADDNEWTFMLGRQSYILLMARQCALTGEAKYADKIAELIEDFIDRSPLTEASKATTWRTLDVGIRLTNWMEAWRILDECGMAPVQILDKMKASIRVHLDYLLSVNTPFLRLSNWGVIGNTGAYQAALFIGNEETAAEMVRRIADELSIQVDPDGWDWEQSPMYHVEVLNAVLSLVRIARRAGRELPAIIPETGLAMCLAVARTAKPNHHQFMQSDSDDTDVRSVLTQGAILFGSPELKAHGYSEPDFESLFWITDEELAAFHALKGQELAPCAALNHSGNYYLRTGWKETDSCIHFHCGYMGSGHGHADLLHVDLCALGRDVLTDSGRLTYVEKPVRMELKAPSAHNTFTLDGVPFTECTASWDYGRVALTLPGAFYSKDGISFAESGHLGYMHLSDPAVCRRYVIQLNDRIAFLLDLCHTQGTHHYEGTFHFKEKDGLRLEGDHAVYEADGLVTEILYPEREAKIETTIFSPHYNTQCDKSTLVLSCTETGLCTMPSVFVSNEGEAAGAKIEELPVVHSKSGKPHDRTSARAWRVTAFGESWNLLFSLKDPVGANDLLTAGEVYGHGRVLVSHAGKQTTLAW